MNNYTIKHARRADGKLLAHEPKSYPKIHKYRRDSIIIDQIHTDMAPSGLTSRFFFVLFLPF